MEWYSIEYLYPNSFKKFIETMFPNVGIVSISTLEYFDNKNLYKFFDKEGIYMTIEMYNKHQWVFNISLENGVVLGPRGTSKTNREESEIDGFHECFKILDKKLIDKQKITDKI